MIILKNWKLFKHLFDTKTYCLFEYLTMSVSTYYRTVKIAQYNNSRFDMNHSDGILILICRKMFFFKGKQIIKFHRL